jgi:hypothetical protein
MAPYPLKGSFGSSMVRGSFNSPMVDKMFKLREIVLLFEAENGTAVEMLVKSTGKDAVFVQVTRPFTTGPFGGQPKPSVTFSYPLHPIYQIDGTIC